jgi:phage terminase small subunit
MLNARQEAFCQNLAKGMSQEAAYEAAGYTARGDSAKVNASRLLLTNADVASRVRELQEASAEEAVVDAATLSTQLEAIRVKAEAAGQYNAAVSAAMGRAKLHGLIIDKAEVKDVTNITPEQRQAEIRRLSEKLGLRVVRG